MQTTVRVLSLLSFLLMTAVAARADVVVGIAGPMSGSFAAVGADIRTGVELAVATLNAAGGIDGERVVTTVADDKCDPETGAAIANQFVGRGVRVVIGHACTSAALAAARVYAAHGVLFLSPAATNPRLTDEAIGPGVFRLAVRSDLQAEAIAGWLGRNFKGKRVAFIHDGGVYGQGLADAAAKAFARDGGTVALTDSFTPGEKSQNNLVGKLQDAAVSAVVMGALQSDAAVIASEVRARGLSAALIGDEALALEEYRGLAGAAAEGTVFMLPRVPRDDPANVELMMTLGERKIAATNTLLLAHAALEAAAGALSGGADFDAATRRLKGEGLPTVIGTVAFDARGDWRDAAYVPYVWKGASFQPVPEARP